MRRKKTLRVSRLSLLILLALSLGLSGCTISTTGSSTKKMKRELKKSFLYRSASIFYPNGLPADPAELDPQLPDKQVKELRQSLGALSGALLRAHAKWHGPLASIFGHPLVYPLKANIVVPTTGNAVAHAEPDGDISVDVRVIQAIFRTALVSAQENPGLFNIRASFDDEPAPKTEREVLADFLAVIEEIDNMKGHTLIGDLVRAPRDMGDLDSEPRGWFKMTELALQSQGVENHYFGTLLFLLGHELGHLAIGHLKTPLKDLDCASRQRIELEADTYSTLIMLVLAADSGTLDLEAMAPGLFGPSASSGFEDFFTYSFRMAGFESDACQYPVLEERLAFAKYVAGAILEAKQTDLFERLDQQWQQQMNSVLEQSKTEAESPKQEPVHGAPTPPGNRDALLPHTV